MINTPSEPSQDTEHEAAVVPPPEESLLPPTPDNTADEADADIDSEVGVKSSIDADDTVPSLSSVDIQTPEPLDHAAEVMPIRTDMNGTTRPLITTATQPMIVPNTSVLDNATRPLQSDSSLLRVNNDHAIFAQATDIGLMRGNNEDSAFSFYATGRSSEQMPDFGLFIVADGMGGHSDGEKASAISTRVLVTQIMKTLYLPLISETLNNDPIVELLADAVQNANHEVVSKVPDGGTTMTAVVVMHDRAYIAHVGDSRAYLIQKGSIEQMTRDHSLVQRLIELDHMTPEEAKTYPNSNVLYRALGQNASIDIDTLTRRLPANSRLLVCSDGLWGQVEEDEILAVVTQAAHPQEACHQLIEMANARGGVDNVTVTILQLPR